MSATARSAAVRTSALAVTLVLCFTVASVGSPVFVAALGDSPGGPVGSANAASATTPSGISDLSYGGPAVAVRQNGTSYVWMNGTTRVSAYVQPVREPGRHEFCVRLVRDNETVTDHGCTTLELDQYGQSTTFELSQLGAAEPGRHDIVVELRDAEDESLNQTRRISVVAVTEEGDIDDDNLTNVEEVRLGTNIHGGDTDSDGLEDGTEVNKYGSDPTVSDTDQDGLSDGPEANEYNTSLPSADTDDDGARDGVEITEGTDPNDPDTDDDGLTDGEEINRYDTDPTVADTDGDGLTDGEEVNQYDTDPLEADTDDDGIEDGEEVERGTDPLVAQTGTGTGTGNAGVGGNGGGGPGGAAGTDLFTNPLVLLLGLVLVAGAAFVTYSRYGGTTPQGAGGSPDDGGAPPGSGGDTADDPGQEPLDPDLLSPEEFVTGLLERNGGRMQQRDIVEKTDWSKAKVSRRLSTMEEDGVIERTRIGRGKVVERVDDDSGSEAEANVGTSR